MGTSQNCRQNVITTITTTITILHQQLQKRLQLITTISTVSYETIEIVVISLRAFHLHSGQVYRNKH